MERTDVMAGEVGMPKIAAAVAAVADTLKRILHPREAAPDTQQTVPAMPERVSCNFCGSDRYTELYPKVVRCDQCGYVYTNPQLSAEALKEYYSQSYIQASVSTPPRAADIHVPPHDASLNRTRELGFVKQKKRSGRLLDVGCAWGGLLYLAREQGFEPYGVEIARPNAQFATEQLQLNVYCGQLADARFPTAHFDAVIAVHMLEHAPNPKDVIREIHRILKQDGVFVVIVPNFASYLREKLGEQWLWLTPDDHYSHFTPEVLQREMARIGFACELRSEEGHYGTAAIKLHVTEQEMARIHGQLHGSELIAICTKRTSPAS
jgi:2-polyprenyl-3-methyl-5-hydroxy-6-metoxy-1,4-benzoquinol methylase